MKTICAWACISTVILISATTLAAAEAGGGRALLDMRPGDQVLVSVGSGFVQQEQFYGYIETFFARRFPDRRIICRNLGWSGDTVWGEARTAGYQNPAGFARLKKQAAELKPDIILVGYGSVESFDGPAGLDRFKDGYGKLLDMLAALTPRLVLISPTFHEDLGRPFPDPRVHNANLELYSEAIRSIAAQRHLPFVDLFHATADAKASNPQTQLTSNGILLNDAGYWLAAQEIERQLGLRPEQGGIEIAREGSDKIALNILPATPAPQDAASLVSRGEPLPVVSAKGLSAGQWKLKIDGRDVLSASAEQWAAGVPLTSGPDIDQVQQLRRLVIARSEFFYRRWNPTNDIPQHYTYIAPDYAMYDARVAELDKEIAERSRPTSHLYEISPKPLPKP